MKTPKDPAAHERLARGDAALRGFMRYMEHLDPQVRARMGQRGYHDLRKAYAAGFGAGLAYADELAPEPRRT